MPTSMQGKTVIVTGGTNGIGFVTARELARMGAQVTIISRSPQKCATAVEEIKKETANPNVEYIAADLSVMANVRQAAYEFKKRHTHLHILVNNAGGFFNSRQLTSDGYEMTFALNHLSYFLLTHLLLDTLKSSAPARIVNVSSDAHRGAKLDFDDLQNEKKFSGFSVYGQSKLANVLFTYQLAQHLNGSGIAVNAVHPGFVATGFAKNNGSLYAIGMNLLSIFARKPDKGAETSIYLASSPEVEGVTGKYFSDCKAVESSAESYDRTAQQRLWETSLELIVSK
jgi:NAD(P)-dependent dehydrogenase (short-subunit alcohol dehydrogenase family)